MALELNELTDQYIWKQDEVHFSIVVYFYQRMHACACVGMVENDQKHLKMSFTHFHFFDNSPLSNGQLSSIQILK